MSDSKSLNHDPLSDADTILTQDFYGQDGSDSRPARDRRRSRKPKPTHYKVICISMYNTDIERLEEKVAELKRRGYTKANKSQLIRMALSQIDLDKVTLPQP
jgi:hypothetical protein